MSEALKTLAITSFHPHISRNILLTGALNRLKNNPSLRIVLIVPDYKKDYFEKTFGGEKISVHGASLYRASATKRGLFFKKLAIFIFNTKSAKNLKNYNFYLNKKRFRFLAVKFIEQFGRFFFVRKFARFLDSRFSPKGFFLPFLREYKPDLVFSTDVQNENDVGLLRDAKDLHIKTVGMVRSWDNLSLRILRIFPDCLFVGSDEIKKEAVKLQGFPEERIVVAGNPHYDRYATSPVKTKEEFLKEFGLPMDGKKIVLFAPISDALIRRNDVDRHILEHLALMKDVRVIVRFPPEKKVTMEGFQKPPNMIYDRPGVFFKEGKYGDNEIGLEDDTRLIEELYYSDAVVTGPTSVALDAQLVDRPVIAVNFYPTPRPFWETVWRFADDHIVKLANTGGIHISESSEDFLRTLKRFLNNPREQANGRAYARAMWFSHADGKSGKRLAEELLRKLGLVDIALRQS